MRYIFLLLLFLSTFLSAQTKFLMPEEAFKVKAELTGKGTVEAVIELGEHIYLYEDQVKVELIKGDNVLIDTITMDEAVDHDGEKVFYEKLKIRIDLAKNTAAEGIVPVTLKLSYQGCSEQGLCYEPMSEQFGFDIDTAALPLSSGAERVRTPEKAAPAADAQSGSKEELVSETDLIAKTIREGNIMIILLTFFGFGLLLSLTPCVFPMIPILSSVIISQGEGMTTKKAFVLSMVYVLAMAAAYTFAGILAGLFGANLQAALQTPWVIVLFALVFVTLALSMFDLYELQVPNVIQSKLTTFTENQHGVIGVAIMGFLSALIVGPCVAAPLAGALIYIGQTGDAVLGGMALFTLSIGMGVPLLIVGTTAGRFMPRPGAWMDTVKAFFGVLMIGVAIWMLSRILPANVTMLLWALLFIFVSVNMGGFEPIKGECIRCWQFNKKAVAIILFLYAVTLFVGALTGSGNLLNPLEKLTAGRSAVAQIGAKEHKEADFEVIHTIGELDAILERSKGKKVMLDFSATWCTACKEYEHITFKDPAVKAKMAEFVLVQADVSANTEEEKALTKKFGLFGPPGIIFFDEKGKQINGANLVGFQPPEKFLAHLNKL
jgi:thiol:disulfide interchange protein DsbD